MSVNRYARLAPEHPFPTGVNDCYDTLKWALANASQLGATPSAGVVVGGGSAGGNIAAVLACLAREEKLDPPITGQYLCVPALLPEGNVPEKYKDEYKSRSESVSDPVIGKLNEDILRGLFSSLSIPFTIKLTHIIIPEIYKPDPTSPLWDPFNHPSGHTNLPKAYFQVAGLDPLRDEAILYDRILQQGGVESKFDFYPGYGHMFWTNWPEMNMSKRFWGDMVKGMGWLLGREV